METYRVQGKYQQDDTQGELEGLFSIEADGTVSGDLVDEASHVPNRKISGRLLTDGTESRLTFLVVPPGDELLNVQYDVTKKGPSRDGSYIGSWKPMPVEPCFRVRGFFEGVLGENVYYGTVHYHTPKPEDDKSSPAEIILERVRN